MIGSTDTNRSPVRFFHNDNSGSAQWAYNARRRAANRRVYEATVRHTPFSSVEEVKEYLSGDRVACMLCGRMFTKLGKHLFAIHAIGANEYRDMYLIPRTMPLVGASAHERYSAIARALHGERMASPEVQAAAIAAMPHRDKTKSAYDRKFRESRKVESPVCGDCGCEITRSAGGKRPKLCRACFLAKNIPRKKCLGCDTILPRYARGERCHPCAAREWQRKRREGGAK